MSDQLSQPQRIVQILKAQPQQKMTARQIAELLVQQYPADYAKKRNNPRFKHDNDFISQIVAEIGSTKDSIFKASERILWQDNPKPRVYWYDEHVIEHTIVQEIEDTNDASLENAFTEHDLYPVLVEYLHSEHHLYCQRINEKRSRNNRGEKGNHWLHPDIVAMQAIDQEWDELVRSCVKDGAGQRVRLWSFEVKKQISSSNVRSSFFQTVSNSSWANEAYLVTAAISSSAVESELRILSALHGVGVILLDRENPSESEILLPASIKTNIDWQSVHRIVTENTDFREYIQLVSDYYRTGRIYSKNWNKI